MNSNCFFVFNVLGFQRFVLFCGLETSVYKQISSTHG